MHKISLTNLNNKKLTQSVLQVSEMLALYNAELARILNLHCGDIGNFASGKKFIQKNSQAWRQAELFLKFHNMLYDFFQDDSVKMRHWLRVNDDMLEDTLFILIVDNNKLEDVILHLSNLKSSEA